MIFLKLTTWSQADQAETLHYSQGKQLDWTFSEQDDKNWDTDSNQFPKSMVLFWLRWNYHWNHKNICKSADIGLYLESLQHMGLVFIVITRNCWQMMYYDEVQGTEKMVLPMWSKKEC